MSDPRAKAFFGGRVQYTEGTPKPRLEKLGGGWYRLPDGRKVQGREKAEAEAAAT